MDGVAEGYPDRLQAEWASRGGGVGTKVKLTWSEPVKAGSVWLFDRPNPADHVCAARIKFSDGSTPMQHAMNVSRFDAGFYIDGASRVRQILSISLPSILPTMVVLLILRMGSLFSVGFEKVLLMYNEAVYETADVISTYVYRRGLQHAEFSYGAAVGLFNSAVNLALLLAANWISKRVTEHSLW